MTSPRHLFVNRANALRSSGPKTSAGKARVGQNARRHGLSVLALHDPARSGEIAPYNAYLPRLASAVSNRRHPLRHPPRSTLHRYFVIQIRWYFISDTACPLLPYSVMARHCSGRLKLTA